MACMPGAYREDPFGATGGDDSAPLLAPDLRRTYAVNVSWDEVWPPLHPLNDHAC